MRPSTSPSPAQSTRISDFKKDSRQQQGAGEKKPPTQTTGVSKPVCEYCDKVGHAVDICRARKRHAQSSASGSRESQKNGEAP
ncbi:hypothetical protein PI125_g12346 [Phytophthora idaei]|nr:hypothetical protein PI125_g12346 [Phytophthora idaei]